MVVLLKLWQWCSFIAATMTLRKSPLLFLVAILINAPIQEKPDHVGRVGVPP
jgi:hypothetical protein